MMEHSRRLAVIGASSFSGRAFCAAARASGHEVMEISRPAFDLARPAEIVAAVTREERDIVVNFAALNMVAESWQYARDYYLTNLLGLRAIADEFAEAGTLRRFVQVSTPEVYGATGMVLDENAPMRPSTPYAVSRAAADMHLTALQRAKGFPVSFTRTVNVYGPGQQPYRIVPKTVFSILRGEKLKLHGGGASRRSFIHIRDVARGTLMVAFAGQPGAVYHMATSRLVQIEELVRMICHRMGADFDAVTETVSERPGKDPAYILSSARIRDELSWCDTTPLEFGLDGTVAWFREHAAEYPAEALEYVHNP